MADRQAPQSFSYAQGEAFVLEFNVDQNILLDTVRFTARRSHLYEPVLSTEDDSAVAKITGESKPGQFTISVKDEATRDLVGTYRYSCEAEDPGGDKSEVAWGYITFHRKMIEATSS